MPQADFTVAMESYPSNLDPRLTADAYSGKVQGLIFNGLMKWDDNMVLVPDLAEGLEFLSDTRMRFKLRQGVRFHDGKPLTSKDVLYTIKSVMDPKRRSPHYATFNKIAEMEAPDDYTIELELKEPYVPFVSALTMPIIPDGADAGSVPFGERPIGTGPFQFQEAVKDQWVLLKANEAYDGGAPALKTVRIRAIRDDTTRILALLRGELDLVQNSIPLLLAPWIAEKTPLKRQSELGINYAYLGLNLKDPLLADRRVRAAMAHAINRKDLIQYRLKGFAREATGILSPSNSFYEGNVETYPYDPAKAKALLDEAGFPDPDGDGPLPRMRLTYKTNNKRDRVAMARAIGRDLEAVGIAVDVRPYEWGTFFRDIRTGNFQMFSSTWVGVTEPDIYYDVFQSEMTPPKGNNRGYYSNPRVDELVQKGRVEENSGKRRQIYAEVQKLIAHDLPYLNLWWEDNVVFTQPNVLDYRLRPDASLLGLAKTRKGPPGNGR